MAASRRITRKGGSKSAKAPLGEVWDKKSGPDEYDGRANTQSGDAGKEPGGRWGPAYWESGPKVIGRDDVRDPEK